MNVNGDKATVTRADGRLAVSGPLTFATVPPLVTLPLDLHAGREPLVVDLAGVPRADSAGLALMIKWWRDTRRAGRVLRVINIPKRLQDLIRVNGLNNLFPNHAE